MLGQRPRFPILLVSVALLAALTMACVATGCSKKARPGDYPPQAAGAPPPTVQQAQSGGNPGAVDPGTYYRRSGLEGRVVTYDPDRDLFVLFGSYWVAEEGLQKREVVSRKFHRVRPATKEVREVLKGLVGEGAAVLGEYEAWKGQEEEVFLAREASPVKDAPSLPRWYAFGKTLRPLRLAKFNLYEADDFVETFAPLKGLLDVPLNGLSLPEVEKLAKRVSSPSTRSDYRLRAAVRAWWDSRWNLKWTVEKDLKAYNELLSRAGDLAFYTGLLGFNNCYVDSSPAGRGEVVRFESAVGGRGGGAPDTEGPATAYGSVEVVRDEHGSIVAAYVSGPFLRSPAELVEAVVAGGAPEEKWKLVGIPGEKLKELGGRKVWFEGRCVLVRDEKGNIVDKYFAVDSWLTREQMDTCMEFVRLAVGEGGI